MIVTLDYFRQGVCLIEGISEAQGMATSVEQAVSKDLKNAITFYGDDYMRELLGCHADDFLAYVNGQSEPKEVYDALLAELKAYKGMQNVSPMAHYIYFKYVGKHQSIPTPMGVVVARTENTIANITDQQQRAWNEMVDMHRYLMPLLKKCGVCLTDNKYMFEYINRLGV